MFATPLTFDRFSCCIPLMFPLISFGALMQRNSWGCCGANTLSRSESSQKVMCLLIRQHNMQNGERVVSLACLIYMSAIDNDVSGYSLALRRLEEKKDYFFLQFLSTIMYFKGSSACQRDFFFLTKEKRKLGGDLRSRQRASFDFYTSWTAWRNGRAQPIFSLLDEKEHPLPSPKKDLWTSSKTKCDSKQCSYDPSFSQLFTQPKSIDLTSQSLGLLCTSSGQMSSKPDISCQTQTTNDRMLQGKPATSVPTHHARTFVTTKMEILLQ